MKLLVKNILKKTIFTCCLIIGLVLFSSSLSSKEQPDVTLTEDSDTYILDNGIVTARVAKASGDLVSLRYKDMEMLATFLTPEGEPDLQRDPPGANPNGLNKGMTDHQYGFWSHDAMGPRGTQPAIASITIDPKTNGGERAEISIKGISNGRKMGTGPGASADGQFVSDIDIRYSLGKGESGVYTYCVFNHKPEYGFTMLGEARFAAKLAGFFDWISVGEGVDKYYPKDLHEGDKYVYTTLQSENPAFGWSSTTKNVGLFFINPSMEYMSGGPTKVEFLGHRDTNSEAAPTVLNYWRSSHYGGAEVNVAEGEEWSKVIGPFMIYVNSGSGPEEIYNNAKSHAAVEKEKWPYSWVDIPEYTKAEDRVTVKGQFVINEVEDINEFNNFHIGLTAGEYVSPRSNPGPEVMTNWQRDAKYYQFWNKGNSDGSFEIPNVRPGKYTLYAFTNGVLGEFVKSDITVQKGKALDLGKLEWTPLRKGEEIWDIGIPNRSASEFLGADKHRDPAISLEYPKLFPNDVNYVIGESEYSKDWFFQHIPHNEDPEAAVAPYRGITSNATRATPYTIQFDLASEPKGKAILRFAIVGTGAGYVDIEVNGIPVARLNSLRGDGVIPRHGSTGIWYEKDVVFDASLMKKGENKLKIIVPQGSINDGIVYDYIRLELDDKLAKN